MNSLLARTQPWSKSMTLTPLIAVILFFVVVGAEKHNKAMASSGEVIDGRFLVMPDSSIILDMATGIEWLRCSYGQQWNGSICEGTATLLSWEEATALHNKNGYLVPTYMQLRSLVYCSNTQQYDSNGNRMGCNINPGSYVIPTVNSQAFPNTPKQSYWSRTYQHYSFNPSAIRVNFEYGGSDRMAIAQLAPVRLMKSPERDEILANRYRVLEDGSIIRDLVTGLEWQRCSVQLVWNGSMCVPTEFSSFATNLPIWENAIVLFDLGGFTLPDKAQLRSLVYCSNTSNYDSNGDDLPCALGAGAGTGPADSPTINEAAFVNSSHNSAFRDMFWTSNKRSATENEPAAGYAISFINGGVYEISATNPAQALLVRATSTSTEPLLPPEKLSVQHLGKDGFKLAWQQVQGATGYAIDVAIDAQFTNMVAGYSDPYQYFWTPS